MIPAFKTFVITKGCHREAKLQKENLGIAA